MGEGGRILANIKYFFTLSTLIIDFFEKKEYILWSFGAYAAQEKCKMTRSLLRALWLVGLLVSVSGCEVDCSSQFEQYNHVIRVYKHSPDHYSLDLQSDPKDATREVREVNFFGGEIKRFEDVPDGNDVWAKRYRVCRLNARGEVQAYSISEIHLHSVREISGGGWNRGKGGRGQTAVVE